LLLQIFVADQALGIAGAADIEPHAGIALGGEPGMGELVPVARAVAPPIWDVFEDRGNRIRLRVLRHPDSGGKPGAVGHRNPDGLEVANLAGRGGTGHFMYPCERGMDGAAGSRAEDSARSRL